MLRCTLLSIKTGGCNEDCKYCAQSTRYKTFVKPTPMMSVDEVVEYARRAKAAGSTRFCMGTAWRELGKKKGAFEDVDKAWARLDLNANLFKTTSDSLEFFLPPSGDKAGPAVAADIFLALEVYLTKLSDDDGAADLDPRTPRTNRIDLI